MSEEEIIDNWLSMRQQQPVQLATQDAYWQQVRIQAAIAAMQGMIVSDAYANIEIANSYTGEKKRVKWDENKIAKAAIAHADALIAELKKGGQDE